MPSRLRLAILLAAAFLCLPAVPARAQEVLACYALHNDLANFDRRAHEVDHYLLPELARSGNVNAAYERSYLGGQDIVRLRMIYEMQRFGCPVPPRDEAWLREYYRSRHIGRKKTIKEVLGLPIR